MNVVAWQDASPAPSSPTDWPPLLASVGLICLWSAPDIVIREIMPTSRGAYMVWDSGRIPEEYLNVVFVDISINEISRVLERKGRLTETRVFVVMAAGLRLEPDTVVKNLSTFELAGIYFHEGNKTYDFPQTRANTAIGPIVKQGIKSGDHVNGRQVTAVTSYTPCLKFTDDQIGYIYGFLRILKDELHFKLNSHLPKECSLDNWMKAYKDNYSIQDSFATHALKAGLVDLDFAGSFFDYDDSRLIDHGPVYSQVYTTYAVRRPVIVGGQWHTIAKLLSPAVWFGVVLTLLASSAAYWLTSRPTISYLYSVFALLGPQLLTGDRPARSVSGFVVLCFSFYSIVMTTAFSADLLNRLVLPKYSERVDTVEGVRNGNYPIADVSTYKNKPTIDEAKMAFAKDFQRYNKMVFEVIKEKYVQSIVFTHFLDAAQIAKFRNIREIIPGRDEHLGVVFNKNFPFKSEISKGVQQLIETGMYKYCQRKDYELPEIRRMSVNQDEPSYDVPAPLNVKHLRPVFCLLAIGVALSQVILLIEIAHHYHLTDRRENAKLKEADPEKVFNKR